MLICVFLFSAFFFFVFFLFVSLLRMLFICYSFSFVCVVVSHCCFSFLQNLFVLYFSLYFVFFLFFVPFFVVHFVFVFLTCFRFQGKWDARRFARGRNVFTPRAPSDPQLAAVYERGQAAWRKRGAPVANSDKQQPPKYVEGTWPVMCPNNGMGLETIARFLGQAGTTATVAENIVVVTRRRSCTGFSGCSQWQISAAKTMDEEFLRPGGYYACNHYSSSSTNIGPLRLIMYLSKDGSELNYAFTGGVGGKFSSGGIVYGPKQPYSTVFSCNGVPFEASVDTKGNPQTFTFSGSISNSCVSLFSDIRRYKDGNLVDEYQVALYGTY